MTSKNGNEEGGRRQHDVVSSNMSTTSKWVVTFRNDSASKPFMAFDQAMILLLENIFYWGRDLLFSSDP